MNSPAKNNQELQEEITRLKAEIDDLRRSKRERKKTEEALTQQQNLYLDLANTQPAGIYRLRVFSSMGLNETNWHDSNSSPYNFDFFNNRFFEILKLNRMIIENNPGLVLDLVQDHDKAEFARKNVEANLITTPFLWEGRFVIGKEIRWMHLESLPRRLPNGDTIWTGILYDITKQKDAQREISNKNDELERINAEKDKFFSILAHYLRSPFNSFFGLTQIMTERLHNLSMEQLEVIAGSMRNSATNLYRLLENLLQWSRIQQGLIPFEPTSMRLQPNIKESIAMMGDAAKNKNIEIICNCPKNIEVCADKNMLQTILRNLISNATKFTPKSGKATLSAKLTETNYVELSVTDTGIGMSPALVSNLFQLKTQSNRFGTEGEPSTGLGLLLCKDFVEKHGGKIKITSEEGKGSTFYITITHKCS